MTDSPAPGRLLRPFRRESASAHSIECSQVRLHRERTSTSAARARPTFGASCWDNRPVGTAADLLRSCRSVLVIDWPSADVPETLVRGGLSVHDKGGPGPTDYSVRELADGSVTQRKTGRRPDHVDLVYVHRPIDELPQIIAAAQEMGARALWYQSGLRSEGENDPRGYWLPPAESRRARALAEAAGLLYVDDRYIADELRQNSVDATAE